MKKSMNIVGQKFGKLEVISFSESRKGHRFWNCICDCGNSCVIQGSSLKGGFTKSCGCLWREMTLKIKHGLSKTPEYRVWAGMKTRCLNPKEKCYPRYGGRGISVCDRWLHSFENFLEDMGKRPSKNHSIERKDNNDNYCKENCYWATDKQQANNKRSNIKTINTETGIIYNTLTEAAEALGINRKDLYYQLSKSTNNLKLQKWKS